MANRQNIEKEDLAIQETLSMTVEERLELLAALIVDKIKEDQANGEPLYKSLIEAET
jgi:hypothetical protein